MVHFAQKLGMRLDSGRSLQSSLRCLRCRRSAGFQQKTDPESCSVCIFCHDSFRFLKAKRPEADPELPEIEEEVWGDIVFTEFK